MPASLTSEGPLRDYELPIYLYYPTELIPNGTRDWTRVRLLQACERLKVPEDRWPKFDELIVLPPRIYALDFKFMPFQPPPFNELQESSSDWRAKTERSFRAYCDGRVKMIEEKLARLVKSGILTRIPQAREPASIVALRHEWATRRYCYNEQYKDMATDKHSPEAIRKHVSLILRTAKVSRRNPFLVSTSR